MAFVSKKDYCGLAVTGKLVCSSDSLGASASDVTAEDDAGDIVASTSVSGGASPSNGYDIKADVPFTGSGAIKLGTVNTVDGAKFMLASVAFGTAAGAAPTFSAGATDVESTATTGDVVAVPDFTLPKAHKAALLFSEATLTGTGCNVIATSYAAAITPTVDRDELGGVNSSDLSAGVLTSTLTINQTSATEPTVTAASGWHISGTLTQTNAKGVYPTWTVTLTKYLARTSPSA